jgi:hypothetical protein
MRDQQAQVEELDSEPHFWNDEVWNDEVMNDQLADSKGRPDQINPSSH